MSQLGCLHEAGCPRDRLSNCDLQEYWGLRQGVPWRDCLSNCGLQEYWGLRQGVPGTVLVTACMWLLSQGVEAGCYNPLRIHSKG